MKLNIGFINKILLRLHQILYIYKMPITKAPAVGVVSSLSSESYDSNFGLYAFCWDRSDPAACSTHYGLLIHNDAFKCRKNELSDLISKSVFYIDFNNPKHEVKKEIVMEPNNSP